MGIVSDRTKKVYTYATEEQWQDFTTKLILENLVYAREQKSITVNEIQSNALVDEMETTTDTGKHLRETLYNHFVDGLTLYNKSEAFDGSDETIDVLSKLAEQYANRIAMVSIGFENEDQDYRFDRVKDIWSSYERVRYGGEFTGSYDTTVADWSVYSYYMDTQDFRMRPKDITSTSRYDHQLARSLAFDLTPVTGYWSDGEYLTTGRIHRQKQRYGTPSWSHGGNTMTVLSQNDTLTKTNRLMYNAQMGRSDLTGIVEPFPVALIRITTTHDVNGQVILDGVDIPFAASSDLKENLASIIRTNIDTVVGVSMADFDVETIIPKDSLQTKIDQACIVDDDFKLFAEKYNDLLLNADVKSAHALIQSVNELTDFDASDLVETLEQQVVRTLDMVSTHELFTKFNPDVRTESQESLQRFKQTLRNITGLESKRKSETTSRTIDAVDENEHNVDIEY